MTNHFAALMLDRFRQELAQLGYSLNIHIVDREDMARCALPATFIQRNRSGNCGIFVRIHLSKLRIDAKIGYNIQMIKTDIDKL